MKLLLAWLALDALSLLGLAGMHAWDVRHYIRLGASFRRVR